MGNYKIYINAEIFHVHKMETFISQNRPHTIVQGRFIQSLPVRNREKSEHVDCLLLNSGHEGIGQTADAEAEVAAVKPLTAKH